MGYSIQEFFRDWKLGLYQESTERLNLEYDNSNIDFDLIQDWKRSYSGNFISLRSSGSSGSNPIYRFGPLEGIWWIEKILKKCDRFLISIQYGKNRFSPIFNKKYKELYGVNPFSPSFSHLWKFVDTKNEVGFCAQPDVWFFLSRNELFLEEFKKRNIFTSTTGWEPFSSFAYNDNMFNLKTGDGFFTCESGNTHCLPFKIKTQDGVANLLNLTDKTIHNDDDEIISKPSSCTCGSKLPEVIHKKCHTFNQFNGIEFFGNNLVGKYSNWQLIKTNTNNHLFVCGDYSEQDNIKTKEHFGEIEVHQYQRYSTGVNKYANFWYTENLDNKKIIPFASQQDLN